MTRGAHEKPHVRNKSAKWLFAASALCFVLAGALIANVLWWYHTQETEGGALLSSNPSAAKQAQNPTTQHCVGATSPVGTPEGHVAGVLNFPALNILAPVLPGVDTATLDVAIGHPSNTPWPGQAGTAVLSAHDVGYFRNIDSVKVGDTLTFATSCASWTYRVSKQIVIRAGADLPAASGQRVALVTCWPLDAIIPSDQRFVTFADLVSTTSDLDMGETSGTKLETKLPPVPSPTVPKALQTLGVSVDQWPVPQGRLVVDPSLDSSIAYTRWSYNVASRSLRQYIAASRTIAMRRTDWWSVIAPKVPWSRVAPLAGTRVTYDSRVSERVVGVGKTLKYVEFAANVKAHGHAYHLVVIVSPHGPSGNSTLLVTKVTITPRTR